MPPAAKLDVVGNIKSSGTINFSDRRGLLYQADSVLHPGSTADNETIDLGIGACQLTNWGRSNAAVAYTALLINQSNAKTVSGAWALNTNTEGSSNAVAELRAVTTGFNDAVPVVFDGGGQLGIKEDLEDMGDASRGRMRHRPITFRYKKPHADGSKPIQYGLMAEEAAEVYAHLVAHSADGQIETVKYQVLDRMLLNELQRQRAAIENMEQQKRILTERRHLDTEFRRSHR